jgi:hypothetical protein
VEARSMNIRVLPAAIVAFGLSLIATASEPERTGEASQGKADQAPAKVVEHPAIADRVVLLHERLEATHIVVTARPQDLRSKEILVGDGMKVSDVSAFLKRSKVRLAAIPAGTTGVVLDTLEPWAAVNEVRAVKVGITSGPLEGQEWWISVPGVAARRTPEGDSRIRRWQALVDSGQRKEPKFSRTYVSPERSTEPRR